MRCCGTRSGFTFFDFLTASDELTDGFRVVSHLADFWGGSHVDHLLVRTLIPRDKPVAADAVRAVRRGQLA